MSARRAAVAALAFAGALFAVFAGYALWFPYALDYGEGPLVDQARRLAEGAGLYPALWNQSPYVIHNYPPVYPVVVAWVATGARLPYLEAGRLVSIGSTVASALLVGAIARRLWSHRWAGLTATALFLANLFIVEWAIVARVDSLALGLSLSGLFILQTRSRSWSWVGAATLALVLAIFTRQTYALAAPLAGAVWLWSEDRPKAIAFVAALGLACGSLFLGLNQYTAGGFYFHIVRANVNHFQWLRVAEFSARLVLVTGVSIVVALFARRDRRAGAPSAFAHRALPAYTVGALLTALTVGKVGSWHNYFLELVVAIVLWGSSVTRARQVVAQAAWAVAVTAVLLQWKLSPGWHERAGYAVIAAEVRAAKGPVLADDAMTMIAAANKPLYYQPFEYRQLQTTGLWTPAPLVAEVTARKFSLIVLRWPDTPKCRERWGGELLDAIFAHYREVTRAGALVSYRPID